MKDMNFKNFNYSLIDSVKKGYKEVLVTFTKDGKAVRKICLVREMKGKNSNYYLDEAKKQINEQINNGTLAKSAAKQIKRAASKGILKPVMVTLSCVLAAGAIGTGGYFTYRYFTNPGGGGGGGGDDNGYTVVLNSGDTGYFSETKSVLVIENVAKGTKLGEIAGYLEPTSKIMQGFNYWFVDDAKEIQIDKNYVIEANTYLNAAYKDTPTSARYKTKNEIGAFYNRLVDGLDPDDSRITYLNQILSTALANDSPLNLDNVDIINLVGDLTNECLLGIVSAGRDSERDTILNTYKDTINTINQASDLSPIRTAAYAKLSVSLGELLLKGFTYNDTKLGAGYEYIANLIKNLDTDEKLIEIFSPFISGFLSACAVISSEDTEQFYPKLLDSFGTETNYIVQAKGKHEEIDIKKIGDIVNSYYLVLSKLSAYNEDAFNAITQLYQGVRDGYVATFDESKNTFYMQSLSTLSKQALDALANLDDVKVEMVFMTATAFKDAIDGFKQACEENGLVAQDDATKITIFYDIYKSAVIGLSKCPVDSKPLFNTITSLINAIVDGEYKDNDIDIIKKTTLETIENMDLKYYETGGGYQALFNVFSDALARLKAAKEKGGDTTLLNTLIKGYIKSSCYTEFNKLSLQYTTQWFNNLTTSIIDKKEDFSSGEPQMVSTLIESFTKASALRFSQFLEIDGKIIGEMKDSLVKIGPANKALFIDEFNKCNLFDNILFICDEKQCEVYYNYVAQFLTYPTNLNYGTINETEFKNGVRTWSLLYANDNLFKYEDPDGTLNPKVGRERFNIIIKSGSFPSRIDYPSYDLVLNIWQESFFSQITPTTNLDKFAALFNEAAKLIKDLN